GGGRATGPLARVLPSGDTSTAGGSKRRPSPGRGGKGAEVVGFFSHPDGVVPGHSNRRKLREIIYDTRDFHLWYVSRLKAQHAVLAGLPLKFEILCRDVQKKPGAWTASLRRTLEI